MHHYGLFIAVLVLCVERVVCILNKQIAQDECCVPEEESPKDAAASGTFLFPDTSYSSIPAYYTYEHPDDGPMILDSPSRYGGGLSYHHHHHYDVPSYEHPSKDNVQVIKSYTNERNSGPVYTETTVTRTKTKEPVRKTAVRTSTNFFPVESDYSSPFSISDNPKINTYVKETHQTQRSKHPDQNKSVYKETTSEGKESSSYNRGVQYKKSYKDPPSSSVITTIGNRKHIPSTLQPRLVTTIGPPIIEITPKYSDKLSSNILSTVGPTTIDITPKYADTFSTKLLSTIETPRIEIKSKFSDKLSEQPLQEAGSIGSSFISNDDTSSRYIDGFGGFGYEKEKDYEKEKAEHYAEGHKKKEGHKSEKDYNQKESYNKGEEEKHGAHHSKGSASEEGSEKKSHIDEAKKFKEGHEISKDAKATDYHHKKGHRKGHKKSGYHTVHTKDEFKKDEHFFDEIHDTGEESAKGHKGHEHSHKEVGEKKHGHHDSGYHEQQHKKHGGKEEAHSHHKEAGHKAEQGHKAQHAEKAEHASKEGHQEAQKHGHSEKHEGHSL